MIIDITPPISARLRVWPGDTPPSREMLLDMQRGDNITLSTLHATVHLGAHADAPSHYGADAASIDQRSLDYYLGECQAVDAELGVLLKLLEETGQLERTLVVASGDHGMPGVPAGKCNLYDHGVAVTLAMRVPGGKGGRVIDDLVRLPDLAPTFMEIGGVNPPTGLYGKSLLAILQSDKSGLVEPDRNWVITGRERHVARAREDNLPYPMRALRTPDFLYIRNFAPEQPYAGHIIYRNQSAIMQQWLELQAAGKLTGPAALWMRTNRPAEELYDTQADPHQIRDLSGDPTHNATLERMRGAVVTWMRDAADQGLINEAEMIQRMWPGGVQPETAQPYILPRRTTAAPTRDV